MHMNLGIHFTLPQIKVLLFEQYADFFINNTISFGQRIQKELSNTDIKIYIENTGIYNYWFIEEAVKELLKFDCFRLTWDVGHNYSNDNNDYEFLSSNMEYIKHLHLHDAIGKKNHLPLGSGEIDYFSILSELGSNLKSIIFETKTVEGLKASVEYFRENMIINAF